MIPQQVIEHIYRQLDSKTAEIENICDEFIAKIKNIIENSENKKLKNNRALISKINKIKRHYQLLRTFCCLWNNPENKQLHVSIKDAVDSAQKLYIDRKGEGTYCFNNIIPQYMLNGKLIRDISNDDERKHAIVSLESFFCTIKDNKLALVPYILIDNATKYALSNSDIKIIFDYDDTYKKGTISINNVGPCIENKERIFQKDVRGKYAQSIQQNRGHGQGLYFAKCIIEELGGNIECHFDEKIQCINNNIPYHNISFKATLYPEKVNNAKTDMNGTYYNTIDSMFSHEYFNITTQTSDKLSNELYIIIHDQFENIGLTKAEAEQLENKEQELNIARKGLFLILNTYAYRKELYISDNRSKNVYWSKLYKEAQIFYNQNLIDANIKVDFKIIAPKKILWWNNNCAVDYEDNRAISHYWCIEYIPLLVYNFIVSIRPTTVTITLEPGMAFGCYTWKNTIEVELCNPQKDIADYINNSNQEPSTYIELLIRMLHDYLRKINSNLSYKPANNNRLILEFLISNGKKS